MEKNGLNAPANADYTDKLVRDVAEHATKCKPAEFTKLAEDNLKKEDIQQKLFAHFGVNYAEWCKAHTEMENK